MLHRNIDSTVNNNFLTQMSGSFDWMTRKIRLIWWASREELIPWKIWQKSATPGRPSRKLAARFQK